MFFVENVWPFEKLLCFGEKLTELGWKVRLPCAVLGVIWVYSALIGEPVMPG